jgi:protein-S-isoprenylcysteine O-methyltransferase Ste14
MIDLPLLIKNIVFTIIAPGSALVLFPYLLLRSGLPRLPVELGPARFIGLIPVTAGVLIYLWCLWDFMRARGTPAPIDPPKELVAKGLYRYMRNPMYVGILSAILGEAILFETGLLVLYALLIFLMVYVFVTRYEEPTLQRLFGESYTRYRQTVGRWLPRMRS